MQRGEFRVLDTPYGNRREASSLFRPDIARFGIDLNKEGTDVLVRASPKSNDELISLSEYHTRHVRRAHAAGTSKDLIALEFARSDCLDQLRLDFVSILRDAGIDRPPNESFNRWLFESMELETHFELGLGQYAEEARMHPFVDERGRDPLIPSAWRASEGLIRELKEDRLKQQESTRLLPTEQYDARCVSVAYRLAELGRIAVRRLRATALPNGVESTVRRGSKRDIVEVANGDVTHEFLVPYRDKFHTMHRTFSGEDECHFANRLFCMLQRYRALVRGKTREKEREGAGHHGAAPPGFQNKLRELLSVQMECFASPFNSHFPYFCSAFNDTDSFFGSIGSFFQFFPAQGSFQVGPPWVEELMSDMTCHLVHLLSNSTLPLSFVVSVPDWVTDGQGNVPKHDAGSGTVPPSPSLTRIFTNADGFTRRSFICEDHAFLDGFQHTYRSPMFRTPNPTMIMIMQNLAGAQKWPVTDAIVRDLIAQWAEAAKDVPENGYRVLARKRERED